MHICTDSIRLKTKEIVDIADIPSLSTPAPFAIHFLCYLGFVSQRNQMFDFYINTEHYSTQCSLPQQIQTLKLKEILCRLFHCCTARKLVSLTNVANPHVCQQGTNTIYSPASCHFPAQCLA